MTSLHRYIAEEIATDHADGLLSRREALHRLALLAEATGFFSGILVYPEGNFLHLDCHTSDRVVRGYKMGRNSHFLRYGTREGLLLPMFTWNDDEDATPPDYVFQARHRTLNSGP